LFYYDNTPDDYEPPHFRKGDADKDRWYFTTHDKTELPERTDVGRLETGWHS
jgi:meiosis-specific protein HOP1